MTSGTLSVVNALPGSTADTCTASVCEGIEEFPTHST